MALTNYERVGKILEVLRNELKPYVEGELKAAFPGEWKQAAARYLNRPGHNDAITDTPEKWDIAALLNIMINGWSDVFSKLLGRSERNALFGLRDQRNDWAHQQSFDTDAAFRVADNADIVLSAISSQAGEQISAQKEELLRQRYEKRARKTVVKVKSETTAGLKGWREVMAPHQDVQKGTFSEAEFAADLWEVHKGTAPSEYQDPREFFRRTYITDGIGKLLQSAIKRLSKNGGDPVIELQTNFGGGKTHSMLALYHLFADVDPKELQGIESLVDDMRVIPRNVRKAVVVGNKVQPAEPSVKKDGTTVNTLWGEIAYQIGGKDGYELVAAADKHGTNPGDALTDLFAAFSPCLILIDEWVAYARQLYTKSDLPAGDFDTQFTFAQTITESAKNAPGTFLVVSIPASENEIGGEGGQAALDRLRNAVGRVQSPWQPATRDEAFEIVRRRLFQEVVDPSGKDAVVKAFGQLYRSQAQEFPGAAAEAEYERRIARAYPIHPELFDQLYDTWSTIDRFQRTRGVLRLMANVVHVLWDRGDSGLLILPSSVPLDDAVVRGALIYFMTPNWIPIIERDVDGAESLPRAIERDNIGLDRMSAVRKTARTIFMATAPLQQSAHRGVDEKSVKLGCVQPGETIASYGDALRRLSDRAMYLYADAGFYWYSEQPTVRRLADDRAGQIDVDRIHQELRKRLASAAREKGDFQRIHVCPAGPFEVADDLGVSLVIFDPERRHVAKSTQTPATAFAHELLDSRGTGPRMYKNTIVFLAPDQSRYGDLDKAVRYHLAWQSIVDDADRLELPPYQVRQADGQLHKADTTVSAQIPETYHWLLVPTQEDAQEPITLRQIRLRTQRDEPLALTVSAKVRSDEALMVSMNGSRLRYELDRVPLWRDDHVAVAQLAEYFARYPYLQRIARTAVVHDAVRDGVSLLSWYDDGFAFADEYDEARHRYVGLRGGEHIDAAAVESGIVVKPERAEEQLREERERQRERTAKTTGYSSAETTGGRTRGTKETVEPIRPTLPRRFFGRVELRPLSPGTDAGKIAEEVIQHLAELSGADVHVHLEIEAHIPDGVPEDTQRDIRENCRTLKFDTWGLEND